MSAHTPGPWVSSIANRIVQVRTADNLEPIVDVWITSRGRSCAEENARLIAAAPDLLEALILAKETIKTWHNMEGGAAENVWPTYERAAPEMKRINAALAKAGVA